MRKKFLMKRDFEILKFLWTWKVLSTKAIGTRFFPNPDTTTCYNRLIDLKNMGYIDIIPLYPKRDLVWTLTRKGFQTISNNLALLQEYGFKSENPSHDFLVSHLHLGDWIVQPDKQDSFFSEQQLRRVSVENFPDWVPKYLSLRPDGYWKIEVNGKSYALALETELHKKKKGNYEAKGDFYRYQDSILGVIWLVPTENMGLHISRSLQTGDWQFDRKHNFICLKDYLKLGWKAVFFEGGLKGKTLSEVLNSKQYNDSIEGGKVHSAKILDTRVITKSSPSHFLPK